MTMDENTLAALRGSIAKWQAIVDGTGEDLGGDNCALCEEFYEDLYGNPCANCPVSQKTGKSDCQDTPFNEWVHDQTRRLDNHFFPRKVFDEKSKHYAQAELDFLKSLLPEEVGR